VTSKRCTTLVALASAVIILAGLKLARDLLVPVLLGMVVAATSTPVVTFLLRKKLPPIVVAIVALALDVVALAALGALFVAAAGDLAEFLPRHEEWFSGADASIALWLAHHGVRDVYHPLAPLMQGERIGQTLAGAADTFAGGASLIAVVLLVAFFTLCEVTLLGDKLRAFVPNAERHLERLDRVIRDLQRYLVVKVFVSLTAALLGYVVLKALGVELALLLAFVLFVMHFIPAVGVPIAMVPAVAVALLSRGVGAAIAVAISYEVIAVLCGNVLEPRLLGRTIGLSPLTVLLSMLFWGWMWGPLGAVIAVPITTVVKIVLENAPGLERWARMLETSPTMPATPTHKKEHPFLKPPRYVLGGNEKKA
jgi:predicted PurR-regulated permease PerM